MRLALCQIPSSTDDVSANVSSVLGCLDTEADVYVFPEMFLTGYFSKTKDPASIGKALDTLRDKASEKGICIIIGGPEYDGGETYNSAYVISDTVSSYRKIHLPNFPPFDEKERFVSGSSPFVFDFGGIRFGLSVCYDIFFPELIKSCTMKGAQVNVCISASPVTSRTAFERVFPARAVENTTYTVFVNNTGTYGDMTFFGGSRAYTPSGELVLMAEKDGVSVFDVDLSVIEESRRKRPVLEDTVSTVLW